MRKVVLSAWEALNTMRHDQNKQNELHFAQLAALYANAHRDTSKRREPYLPKDFFLYGERTQTSGPLKPEVAATAIALRSDQRAPRLLIAIWNDVLASLVEGTKTPDVRALHSDDDSVWLLAPAWEGSNIRPGLTIVQGAIHGTVTVRDLDRPLNQYRITIPHREGFGWLEANSLLLAAENSGHGSPHPPN